jgi:hypothetical protein
MDLRIHKNASSASAVFWPVFDGGTGRYVGSVEVTRRRQFVVRLFRNPSFDAMLNTEEGVLGYLEGVGTALTLLKLDEVPA